MAKKQKLKNIHHKDIDFMHCLPKYLILMYFTCFHNTGITKAPTYMPTSHLLNAKKWRKKNFDYIMWKGHGIPVDCIFVCEEKKNKA